MENNDISLLVHENLFNNLFSEVGDIERKEKKYTIRISNLNFKFLDGSGRLNAEIQIKGKREIINIERTVEVDMRLNYNIKKNAVIVDIGEVKMNFGKLIGDINLSKMLKIEDYEFPMPDIIKEPLLINDNLIKPEIADATIDFIPNAIKVTYKIDYK